MPARKRQRENVNDDDDENSKRHRGRPRVNEQDETAADVSANFALLFFRYEISFPKVATALLGHSVIR
jgi:hypothetical protein